MHTDSLYAISSYIRQNRIAVSLTYTFVLHSCCLYIMRCFIKAVRVWSCTWVHPIIFTKNHSVCIGIDFARLKASVISWAQPVPPVLIDYIMISNGFLSVHFTSDNVVSHEYGEGTWTKRSTPFTKIQLQCRWYFCNMRNYIYSLCFSGNWNSYSWVSNSDSLLLNQMHCLLKV